MMGGEYTGNRNMLDYLCEQSQKSVEKYYKKLNNDLVKEIQTEKSKVVALEHNNKELAIKLEDCHKKLQKKEMEIQELKEKLHEK